ncbi:MAG: DUF5348 domain-containing protein [Clostridium paraputrificum]
MDNYKSGYLGYNFENDRFGILDSSDLWINEGLHCGESMYVYINDEWIPDRLEMYRNGTWYLVETKLEGDKLEGLKVKFKY